MSQRKIGGPVLRSPSQASLSSSVPRHNDSLGGRWRLAIEPSRLNPRSRTMGSKAVVHREMNGHCTWPPFRETDFQSCGTTTKQRLVELIGLKGQTGGTLEEFFGERELYLAQSGGDNIKLEVFLGGKSAHKDASCIHLKKRDRTAPQNCPRIYYQAVGLASGYYVSLLMWGPIGKGILRKLTILNQRDDDQVLVAFCLAEQGLPLALRHVV